MSAGTLKNDYKHKVFLDTHKVKANMSWLFYTNVRGLKNKINMYLLKNCKKSIKVLQNSTETIKIGTVICL